MTLQITEKSGEGLSRVYGVTVPASDLTEKLEAKIAEMRPRMQLKGFRPGKVPASHVKKMYGREMMGEIVQEAVNEANRQALEQGNVRPAGEPELDLDQASVERVMAGQGDLTYDLKVDVMPDFEPTDVSELSLTRPVHTPSEEEVEEQLQTLAQQNRTYDDKDGAAEDEDMVVIDFLGRIDGEAFEGGSAEDAEVVIGSGRFIPGFEEQLIGATTGEDRTISVSFPEDYGVATLAGKAAEFETKVKAVRSPKETTADDAFAEQVGFESLDALRNAVRVQLEQQYAQASRFKAKRALLDVLDSRHDFPLPPRMVDGEFEAIWRQVEAERERGELSEEDKTKSEADLQAEYRRIAERRVRLGLLLAEIGRRENVSVTDQELNQALMAEARKFPGQEKQVFDFYRENPQATTQLRAPIYEEKVVDLILSRAQVEDQEVSEDALFADDEMPEGYGESGDVGTAAKAPAEAAVDEPPQASPVEAELPADSAFPEAVATDVEASPKPKKPRAKTPVAVEGEQPTFPSDEAAPEG